MAGEAGVEAPAPMVLDGKKASAAPTRAVRRTATVWKGVCLCAWACPFQICCAN